MRMHRAFSAPERPLNKHDILKETTMATQTLKQLLDEGVEGRHVLVRSDFNVPLDELSLIHI